MHEVEEQVADYLRLDAGSPGSDLSQIAAQPGAPPRTADTLWVSLERAPERDQHTTVLSAHGEIDLETAPALRQALRPVLEQHTGPVVVDLSEVPFMDSTGLHILVDTLQRLKLANRRLAIVCCEGGPVHRLLGLTSLLDALAVHRSRESALDGGDDLLRSEPDGQRSRSTA
jgi:anti-sigma B factor antagonist